MNDITRHGIAQAVDAIAANRCDPFVVKSMLIDLREASAPKSILREVGDFMAHPAKRDRGLNHQNIERMAEEMRAAFEQGGPFTIEPTFHGDQIINELGDLLIDAGFGCRARDVIRADADDFLICLLSLLQGARFEKLPVSAEAFVAAEKSKLVLECKFPSMDLGVPAYGRPHVNFAVPLIVTAVDAPESVLRPGRDSGRSIRLFWPFRERDDSLSLRQVC